MKTFKQYYDEMDEPTSDVNSVLDRTAQAFQDIIQGDIEGIQGAGFSAGQQPAQRGLGIIQNVKQAIRERRPAGRSLRLIKQGLEQMAPNMPSTWQQQVYPNLIADLDRVGPTVR